MAFLTFSAADVFDGNGIDSAVVQVFCEFRIAVIEFVAMHAARTVAAAGKVNFRGAMAVDAPAHTEVGELADLIHRLDRPVAGLALHLPYPDVLRMVEVSEIGEVMDLYPFDGMAGTGIPAFIGVIAGVAVQFSYLFIGVDAAAVGAGEFFAVVVGNGGVAVHADIW